MKKPLISRTSIARRGACRAGSAAAFWSRVWRSSLSRSCSSCWVSPARVRRPGGGRPDGSRRPPAAPAEPAGSRRYRSPCFAGRGGRRGTRGGQDDPIGRRTRPAPVRPGGCATSWPRRYLRSRGRSGSGTGRGRHTGHGPSTSRRRVGAGDGAPQPPVSSPTIRSTFRTTTLQWASGPCPGSVCRRRGTWRRVPRK